jgi:hypothetical protein
VFMPCPKWPESELAAGANGGYDGDAEDGSGFTLKLLPVGEKPE